MCENKDFNITKKESEGDSSVHNAESVDEIPMKDVEQCLSLISTTEDQSKKVKANNGKIPRLLNQDIRRLYSRMIMNVLNAQDFPLMYGLLDTYYVPNVQLTFERRLPDSQKMYSITLNGVQELAKYWYSISRMSPDNVIKLSDVTFHPKKGTISCKFLKVCTHIYEPPNEFGYYITYVFNDDKYGKEILYANDKFNNDYVIGRKIETNHKDIQDYSLTHSNKEDREKSMRSIMDTVENVVTRLPLCNPPKAMVGEGTFMITTDENKRIAKIGVSVTF